MKFVWVDGLGGVEPQVWNDDWEPMASKITVLQTHHLMTKEEGSLSLAVLAATYPYRSRSC